MLRAHYPGLGTPSPDLRQSGAMELNSNNFLVEAGGAPYIVKRWPSGPGSAAIAGQAALANWLGQQGHPVPAILPADTGALVVEDPPGQPHSHEHRHDWMRHQHPHMPDMHHTHRH